MDQNTKTNLISEAVPFRSLGLVPSHIVQLSEEVETDVHTGNTEQYSITPSVQRPIVFSVDV